jgi:puromycin-sensitive aminopeptidase
MPAPDASSDAPDAAHRLPRTVEPLRYRLTLAPDLAAATFSGTVEIDLTVHQATTEVVCNAAELAIADAVLSVPGGGDRPADVRLDEGAERATFALDGPVPAGPATLRCSFTGVLNDQLRGFYRSTFTDADGATRTIATTQMESTDARRAFPCWDEPDRKAVFEVTLVVDEGLAAYSNSSVVSETAAGGTRTVRFAPTMKMSTYLVAFVVGPLEVTAPVDAGGVPVRVVHAPGKAHLTGYALEVAVHSLAFFTEYFGIPYPADKLDLVAIPDFAFGAMENLGCVTFRETALLIDPARAARVELERIADVVAHEIAHMWFGDLVTMGWWEGIWLNEAFATFMEVLCVDAFRPDWQRWVSFGLEREAALAVDGLHTTRPIEYPVGSPEEADGMFDVLTYQKGGSVLRMLERYLGADTFRDGVRRYLRAHSYANTVTADLWAALEEASGEPVRSMMDSWILQGGHPLVRVEGATLSQSPFTYGAAAPGTDSAIGRDWQIPVLVRGPGGEQRLLLGTEPAAVPDGSVVNAGGWGVYRVGYDTGRLAGLAGDLASLDPLERCNLFADTWAVALSGRAGLDDFLTLASGLGRADGGDPGTWAVVTGALTLCDRVADEAERPAVEAAVQALCGTRAAELGWDPREGEGERIPRLRALLLGALGTVGADPGVRAEAVRRFDTASGGAAARLDPDTETAVLHTVAALCRPGDYDAYVERYRHPATPQEELRYLTALAAFPDADLTLRTFDLACTEVRTQNVYGLVATLLGNREGGAAVWEALKDRWTAVLERVPPMGHSRMLDGVRALCRDPGVADDVARFLADHLLSRGQRSVAQTLERLRINVAFGERWRGRLGVALGGAGRMAG